MAECQYHGPAEASCVTFDRRACCAVELFLVASQDAANLVPVIYLPAFGTHPLPIRIAASGARSCSSPMHDEHCDGCSTLL